MSTLSPTLKSADAEASIRFLKDAFGFTDGDMHRGEDGTLVHAELWCGDTCVMFGTGDNSLNLPVHPAWCYVVVEDADAHHDRAVKAGAEIIMPLVDTSYGSRDYGAKDPDGNIWSFGTYRPAKR